MLRRLTFLILLVAPATALAQYAPPPPPPQYPPPPPPGSAPYEPPPPPPPYQPYPYQRPYYAPVPREYPMRDTGFQLAVRASLAFPGGTAVGNGDLGNGVAQRDIFTDQLALTLDLGWRPIPQLFLGGYLGVGFGGVGDQFDGGCDLDGASCSSDTFRIGLEAIFHLSPHRQVDPWIGYGLGFEFSEVTTPEQNPDNTVDQHQIALSGFEWAHFLAGIDFRVSRVMSIGPFFDLSFGTYTNVNDSDTDANTQTTLQILNNGTHVWLQVGVQAMVFP